jgi:glutaredoxin
MDVELFTWAACKHCETARELLRERGIPFVEQRLDLDRALKDELAREHGRATMPYARIDGELFGGVAEIEERLGRGA